MSVTAAKDRLEMMRAMERAILEAEDARLPVDVRRAVYARAEHLVTGGSGDAPSNLDQRLQVLVDKTTLHAYKVLDEDVDALTEAGFSDDAIFEAVIATSVSAGLARLDIGLAALEGKE